MKHIATFQILDVFYITGRGIVFLGKVVEGDTFRPTDFIEFEFNNQIFIKRIKGIDNSMRVPANKPSFGILIETKDQNEVSDLLQGKANLTIGKIFTLG